MNISASFFHHKKTIELNPKKTRVKVVGNIRSRVTAVLMVNNQGRLYDPCIIQQGSGKRYNDDASLGRYVVDGLNIWKQVNNTMTSGIMVDLIYKYIDPLFDRLERKLLVMDSFTGHTTDAVKYALRECNIDLVVIPGGCTKYLQPLDISVNRSFKSRLKDSYQSIGNYESIDASTTATRLKKLVACIKDSACRVSRECVMNGWRKMLEMEV